MTGYLLISSISGSAIAIGMQLTPVWAQRVHCLCLVAKIGAATLLRAAEVSIGLPYSTSSITITET